MFIAIEGIDGAGKTSVAKKIAVNLGYSYKSQKALSTYMEIENDLYLNYCDNFRKNVNYDVNSMLMLYSLSCYLAGSQDNVVCDRHLLTVYFWYGNEENFYMADAIYKMSRKPDITIVLNVSADTAIERIRNKRIKKEISESVYLRDLEKAKRAGEFVQRVESFLSYFNLNYYVVDGNKKTVQEIVDEIMLLINI